MDMEKLIKKRISQFPKEGLQSLNGELFCSRCNILLKIKKSTVENHLNSMRHQSNSPTIGKYTDPPAVPVDGKYERPTSADHEIQAQDRVPNLDILDDDLYNEEPSDLLPKVEEKASYCLTCGYHECLSQQTEPAAAELEQLLNPKSITSNNKQHHSERFQGKDFLEYIWTEFQVKNYTNNSVECPDLTLENYIPFCAACVKKLVEYYRLHLKLLKLQEIMEELRTELLRGIESVYFNGKTNDSKGAALGIPFPLSQQPIVQPLSLLFEDKVKTEPVDDFLDSTSHFNENESWDIDEQQLTENFCVVKIEPTDDDDILQSQTDYMDENNEDPDWTPNSKNSYASPKLPRKSKPTSKYKLRSSSSIPASASSISEQHEHFTSKSCSTKFMKKFSNFGVASSRSSELPNAHHQKQTQPLSLSSPRPSASTKRNKKVTPAPKKCRYCTVVFTSFKNLWAHQVEVHNVQKRKIKANQAIVDGTAMLEGRGRPSHSKTCPECGQHFQRAIDLRFHWRRQHKGIKLHQCEQCGQTFSTPTNLNTHMDVKHKGIQRFECVECNLKFNYRLDLMRHNFKHTGIKTMKCQFCISTFDKPSNRRRHYIQAHSDIYMKGKPFSCSLCWKVWPNEAELEQHQKKVHFYCHICGKGFDRQGRLKSHVWSHTGEKPIHCDLCDQSFRRKCNLIAHVQRVHTKERCHKCPEPKCTQIYPSEETLNAHIQRKHPNNNAAAVRATTVALGCGGGLPPTIPIPAPHPTTMSPLLPAEPTLN